jgi:hypothetical protein
MKVNVAVASPGDVEKERDSVLRVFSRWNNNNDELAFLNAVMWEFSSVPTLGDHPQHLLNDQLIDKSDILIAIFWSKLGTPTPTANSGTVEEIREFIKRKGPGRVMLYFCRRDVPYELINPSELSKLQEFKEQMRTQGLFHQYQHVEEFERDLYQHLDSKIERLLADDLPLPVPPKKPEKQNRNDLSGDPQLRSMIDFGSTPEAIAKAFGARIQKLDSIDGVRPNKYYRLGGHVYASAAECLDRSLTNSASKIPAQDRKVLERISTDLKDLATNIPDKNAPFPDYWTQGLEISKRLATHVAFMKMRNRG